MPKPKIAYQQAFAGKYPFKNVLWRTSRVR